MIYNLSCNEIKTLLSAYIDNELADEDRKSINQHIKTCKKCQKELKQLKKLSYYIQLFLKKQIVPVND